MKRQKSLTNRRRGFTLLEVLLVLAILIAIAAMVVPRVLGTGQEAYKQTTLLNIKGFEAIATQYAIKYKALPSGGTDEVMQLLMQNQDERGNFISPFIDKPPLDAWDQPLQYEFPSSAWQDVGINDRPLIWSAGPDKIDGSEDDISNLRDYQNSLESAGRL